LKVASINQNQSIASTGPVVYSLAEFIELGHVENYADDTGDGSLYNRRTRSQSSETDLAMIM